MSAASAVRRLSQEERPAGRRAALLVLALAGVLLARPAAGLDPTLSLAQYVSDTWTTEDGLPQSSVTSILQTRDGYLWLATFGGLARFDGVRFTVYDASTPGFASSRLLALYEDRAGRLWIGSEDGGLIRKDGDAFTTFTTRDGLPDDRVYALREDTAGRLWVGTNAGLVQFAPPGRPRVYTRADGLPDDVVLAIAAGRTPGELWIGTRNGAARLRGGRFTAYGRESGLPHAWVYAFATDRSGALWASTHGGLARWEGEGRGFRAAGGTLAARNEVTGALVADRDGSLWWTAGGLQRLRAGAGGVVERHAGLGSTGLRSVYEDREGNLWVGTDGAGLVRLRAGSFVSYGTAEGLPEAAVVPITEDAAGTVWAGALCGGLARLAAGGFVREPLDRRALGCVTALYADRDGSLWAGANGLWRHAGGRWQEVGIARGLPHVVSRAILRDRAGVLWVGTIAGLARLEGEHFRLYTTADGLVDDEVLALADARAGGLWIGTRRGLGRFRAGRFTRYTAADGLPHDHVRALHEDAGGALWIGTYGGGLARLERGVFTRWGSREGLPNGVVSRILDDGRGYLWLTTNRGVVRVRRAELAAAAAGRRPLSLRVFGVRDGMRSAECNGGGQPAGWRGRDGRLWFPTVQGAVVVDPARLRANARPPLVHVEQVVADGEPLPLGPPVRLPVGAGEVEIAYTGIGLAVPGAVRFRYRLDGFDRDWQEAGARRVAYYMNLPPGRYDFRVIAANEDGVWSPAGASVALRLPPRFHQTVWFLGLGAVTLVVVGGGAYKLRMRVLRARQRELREARDVAVFTLAKLAELRDGTTGQHLERIAAYSQRLAEELRARGHRGVDGAFIEQLGRSSPLHDIGKVATPDAVLRKPGGLDPGEQALMREHTTVGGDVLRSVIERHGGRSFLALAMEIAYSHHERWDGSGYPRGLAGAAIPLAARIVALVDAYDAIISRRPYKPPLAHDEAVRRIAADRGRHFDPELVDAFLAVDADFLHIADSLTGEAGQGGPRSGRGLDRSSKTVPGEKPSVS